MHKNIPRKGTSIERDGFRFYCKDKFEKKILEKQLLYERLKIINHLSKQIKQELDS